MKGRTFRVVTAGPACTGCRGTGWKPEFGWTDTGDPQGAMTRCVCRRVVPVSLPASDRPVVRDMKSAASGKDL